VCARVCACVPLSLEMTRERPCWNDERLPKNVRVCLQTVGR
jgi:hypothetical protein